MNKPTQSEFEYIAWILDPSGVVEVMRTLRAADAAKAASSFALQEIKGLVDGDAEKITVHVSCPSQPIVGILAFDVSYSVEWTIDVSPHEEQHVGPASKAAASPIAKNEPVAQVETQSKQVRGETVKWAVVSKEDEIIPAPTDIDHQLDILGKKLRAEYIERLFTKRNLQPGEEVIEFARQFSEDLEGALDHSTVWVCADSNITLIVSSDGDWSIYRGRDCIDTGDAAWALLCNANLTGEMRYYISPPSIKRAYAISPDAARYLELLREVNSE